MNANFPRLIGALIFLVIVSCGATKDTKKDETDEEKKNAPVEGPKLVGRIASIPPDKKFVLIQSYGKWQGETGQILTTRGPENRTANLRTTGEKLGEFAAADIQSGMVELGDAVYFQHVPKPVTTSPSPDSAQPTVELPIENVQKNN